jgi:hypothetical protein
VVIHTVGEQWEMKDEPGDFPRLAAASEAL